MSNVKLELLGDCANISGVYYTVSNGFISKAQGEVKLTYKDLLRVEIVKHRSKKIMYVTLLMGAILLFVLSTERISSALVFLTLTASICLAGIAYLFFSRQFVEITSMRGTYRIDMKRGDMDIINTITQLQNLLQR